MENIPDKLNLEGINFDKVWEFPKAPNGFMDINLKERKTRQDFINEYFPTGHKIFDTIYYPDLYYKVKGKVGKEVEKQTGKTAWKSIPRKRISAPIQHDSTAVILAHIFGNRIVHRDISPIKDKESNKIMTAFQNLWDYFNMDSLIQTFFERTLICGDAAFFLTTNSRKEIVCKTLSFLDKDKIAVEQNIQGEVLKLYRQYSAKNEQGELNTYIDVITSEYIATYTSEGDVISYQPLLQSFIPIVYHYRPDGAWWSFVQSNIDEYELEFSDLSQDNKAKAKGKYFMSTTSPHKVNLQTFADSDVFVADKDSDMKIIQPANFSEAFKFTMEENKEIISHSLGYIFPKVQSSGDLPTGSMKAQFYPTERICKKFINEFAPVLDEISWIFQQLIDGLYPELNIGKVKISSKIKLFSPTDNLSTMTATADAYSKGAMTIRGLIAANQEYLENSDIDFFEEERQREYEAKSEDKNKTSVQTIGYNFHNVEEEFEDE